jgi:RND family efflux transporter MFP subunit
MLLLLPMFVITGCGGSQATTLPPMKAPEVLVSLPVTREVTEYEDFTGQTQALDTIEVRARVSGYLSKMQFKEGIDVKEGDVLFEIDPRPYKAALAQAEANLIQAQAHAKRLGFDLERDRVLLGRGAVSQADYDKTSGDKAEAEAAVGSAAAMRDTAKLNLEFTQVTAPISGRISRRLIDPWNMVKADETALTTIVSLERIYAYFDVDEPTVLRLRRLVREGKIKALQEANMRVLLGLADEEGYPHEGTVNFVDNQIDGNTGTLRMRGVFQNHDHLLTPGCFVRIRLPIGTPHNALLVSEQALGRDQGQKYLFVVNDKEQVVYRRVKVGRLYDGLREVLEGLSAGERVIVSGLQRVRPDVTVTAKSVDMPSPQGAQGTGIGAN